jgi:iron complex transport system substrate-binding protein
VFPDLREAALGKDRIIAAERVLAAAPEVFIGSWCGKPVRKEKVRVRPGWDVLPFVRDDRLYEVKSTYILQPGPAALTEGVKQIHAVLCRAMGVTLPPTLRPAEKWDAG